MLSWDGTLYHSRGHRLQFQNEIVFFFFEDHFCLSKQCRPDEMPHYVAFHLGLNCLPSTHLGITSIPVHMGEKSKFKS